MTIADTSVWVDYFRGRETPAVARLQALLEAEEDVGVGDAMLCEVLQGFRSQREVDAAREEMLRLPVVPMLSTSIAVRAAENYRTLRRLGITVRGTIDCLIATAVIEGGHTLLHTDRDFDPFEAHLGLCVLRD